jgi:hypothetical protein
MLRKRSGNWTHTSNPKLPEPYPPSYDPFAKLESIQLPASSREELEGESVALTQGVLRASLLKRKKTAKTVKVTYLVAPVTVYSSDAKEVPPFREYAHYRTTVLSQNDEKLISWPWGEEHQSVKFWENLTAGGYDIPTPERHARTLGVEKSQLYQPYVKAFLNELELTWDHIIFWFLADEDKIKDIGTDFNPDSVGNKIEALLPNRNLHDHDYDKEGTRWKAIIQRLHGDPPSAKEVRLSALVAFAFQELCGFELIHIARYSEFAPDSLPKPIEVERSRDQSTQDFSYLTHLCRICFM